VFTVSTSTNLNGQKQTRSAYVNGSVNANRTTANWKLDFSVNESYSEDVFKDVPLFDTLGNQIGSQDIRSFSRQYSGNVLIVKSLGPHWSAGLQGFANHSTFGNLDLSVSFGPGLEYNVYPYAQSTRRQLTLQYGITPLYADYTDSTIYSKTRETIVRQSLTAALSVTQPWGSANMSLTGSHLLQDFKQNRVVLFGSVSLRLVKGLSLSVFGDVERIHDQRALPAAGATPSEILLRRRELLTSFKLLHVYQPQLSLRLHAQQRRQPALRGRERDVHHRLGGALMGFPGEPPEYRAARDQLRAAERQLRRHVEQVAVLRRTLPLGGALKEDYVFGTRDRLVSTTGLRHMRRLSEGLPIKNG